MFTGRLGAKGVETSEIEESGIGTRVRAARERLGWSREALAYHSGVSWSAIAQVETGRRRNLRPATMSALSRALGVSIDYLVGGAPPSPPMLSHQALIYGSHDEFLEIAGPFLAEGIERSEAVLAVTSSANVNLLRERLGSDARQVDFVDAATWYRTPASALDAYKAVSNARLEDGAPWVRILGEPVWAGRSDSEIRLWTRYEALLNIVFGAWPSTVLCPYDERSVDPKILRQARLTHPQTISREGIVSSPAYTDPAGFVLGP
jgi:transcriptional regulator with XRE-family HTH domain